MKFWKAVCGVTVLFYCVGAFISVNPNPFEWHLNLRIMSSMLWAFCIFIAFVEKR